MTPRALWLGGGAGLLVSAVAMALSPAAFAPGWLAALAAWLGWPLGSLALLLVHRLTGGQWGDALRTSLRSGMAALPLLVPALVPVLLCMGLLYPWGHAHGPYMNPLFVVARLLVCVVVWGGLAALVWRGRVSERLAGAGLFALALTWTSASIDLLMSLDPKFNSTIWGMLTGSEAVLLALAVAVALVAPRAGAVLEDLAKLLLALVILWTYLDFMQLLIVWQSDLHADAPWYAVRATGLWGGVMAALAVLRFVVPFLLLLPGAWRRRPGMVRAVAVLLAATQMLRDWWLVLPSVGRVPGLVDAAAMLGFAAVGFGTVLFLRDRAAAHG